MTDTPATPESNDALPEDLDVTAYVGPYLFPSMRRRRIPAYMYLVLAALCAGGSFAAMQWFASGTNELHLMTDVVSGVFSVQRGEFYAGHRTTVSASSTTVTSTVGGSATTPAVAPPPSPTTSAVRGFGCTASGRAPI